MKRTWKVGVLVLVLASLFFSSVLVASAEVTYAEGILDCSFVTTSGTATSPYVTLYVYNYTSGLEYFTILPVTGGAFSGQLNFPQAAPDTLFLIQVWGSLNPYTNIGDSGYWDGESYITVDEFPCGQEIDLSCTYPLPADSVVYDVPLGAPTFYDADLATKLNFDLPAGTWKISEFEGDFAKVWMSCEANPFWIPRNSVGQAIG